MSRQFATQRDQNWANSWANARADSQADSRANAHDSVDQSAGPAGGTAFDDYLAGELDAEHTTEPLRLVPLGQRPEIVRSTALLQNAHEIGNWSLEYLGPGFHVQLRIARRNRQARLDGWMSPARPITVLLSSLLRKPVILETRVSDSGRFEFPIAPTGACRMSFIVDEGGRPPATPPFWV